MGTQVHCKGYLPSYYSMRDLNEDSNSSSWPLFYGDKTLPNGQYCNGFTSRTITDAYPGYDKDILKQKMLEHEAIFKNQVILTFCLFRKNLIGKFYCPFLLCFNRHTKIYLCKGLVVGGGTSSPLQNSEGHDGRN